MAASDASSWLSSAAVKGYWLSSILRWHLVPIPRCQRNVLDSLHKEDPHGGGGGLY